VKTSEPGRLHVITDESMQSRFTHLELGALAGAAGADVVQFREKRAWSTRDLLRTARALREKLSAGNTRLIVNDRTDVAAAAEADGVHLGKEDLEPAWARRLLGEGAMIGATANNIGRACVVARPPVDYVGVGPVFGTRSKADPAPMLGIERLRQIVEAVRLPVIAIGGITTDRVEEVLSTGAYGVAVLSAVSDAKDPGEEVARFAGAIARATRAGGGR
jgi:thiamine-phosphate pyrophosphorylase